MNLYRTISLHCACLLLATVNLLAQQAQPVWPDELSQDRREFLTPALAFFKQNPAVPYKLGSADATGMDCSGAIFYLLKQAGQEPPRSAHEQYLWMKKLGRLTEVPVGARTRKDPAYAALLPGDLVFYAHDLADTSLELRSSHVHIYLGKEADGHAIMIGSSEGRSYRGTKIHGFGITDYKVPKAGSATRIIAYGPPPPLDTEISTAPSKPTP